MNVAIPGTGGDVEQKGGEAVGQGLGPALRGLGLGHQALDAREGSVLTDSVDPNPHRGIGRDSAGDDPITRSPATGLDSPVTIDSSNSASPSMTTPSAGVRAPGRTRTTSPGCNADRPDGETAEPAAGDLESVTDDELFDVLDEFGHLWS